MGILAMQGAFREHRLALERCGVEAREVRTRSDLEDIEGLIIPGGESTAISLLAERGELFEILQEKIGGGLPVYGTCAGAILLAREVVGNTVKTLAAVDVAVQRNAYGRQVDSFEVSLAIPALGSEPFRAVFIRAPRIERIGSGVEVLAAYGGSPVLVRQGKCLLSCFHPELTGDLRLHRYFLNLIAA